MISPTKIHPRAWVSIWSDPELAAEAEDLARRIAGEGASDHILALARDVAAARIDQRRVREVGDELSRGLPGDLGFIGLLMAATVSQVRSPARSMILAIHRYDRRGFSRWKKAERAFKVALRREQRREFAILRRHFAAKNREELKRAV